MKKCNTCKIPKNLDKFSKNKSKHDGLQYQCKLCVKKYRRTHRVKISASHKAYLQTDSGRKAKRKQRSKYPNANRSRNYFSRYKPTPPDKCSSCYSLDRIEAHHHDYNLPMNVTYLCLRCHRDWHNKNAPLNRIYGIFTS